MKLHITMMRDLMTLVFVINKFFEPSQVQILRSRTHNRKGSAYMTLTLEGPDVIMSEHVVQEMLKITGVERVLKDSSITPEPPDFAHCQNYINSNPFVAGSSERCDALPLWIMRNKNLSRKGRRTLCGPCKEIVQRLFPSSTFQKI